MTCPKNIVLLSVDALRADHLSYYGYTRETSPNMDKLADESIRFTNAFSASSHTREAIPALLTGKYPDEAVDGQYKRASDTIATFLGNQGFATGGFHSNPYVSRAYGFDAGFDVFDDDLYFGSNRLFALAQRLLDKIRNRHYALAETINERALSWLDSLDDNEPFFLWNHYMDPHGPYYPPREYQQAFTNQRPTKRKAKQLYRTSIDEPEKISSDNRQIQIDLYDGEISYLDEQIGAFCEALVERNLLSETLLVLTADHGDAFGEHGYYGHPRYLHEEVTRIPLIIRQPEGAGGKKISKPVSSLDVAVTILTSLSIDRDLPGMSLLDLSDNQNRTVFQQARGEGGDTSLWRFAARTENDVCLCWIGSENESVTFEECSNPSLQRTLQKFVKSRENKGAGSSTKDGKPNEEIERRLSALGYKE
jgi:arylsulfatase